MRVRMTVNREGFSRLRTRAQAMVIDDADRSGPLLTVLDGVARKAAKTGIQSEGGGAWPALTPKYEAWKAKRGYGSKMMILARAYRSREAEQLSRKFTLAEEGGHVKRWLGGLRYDFGVTDDVGYVHEQGGGKLPRRSVTDSIYAARDQFIQALRTFWQASIQRVLRHS